MSISMNLTRLVLMISLATLISACGTPGENRIVGSVLTGDEVKRLIGGNTIEGPAGGREYRWYYATNGNVTGVIGRADDDSGKWFIKGDNTYCHQWIDFFGGVEHCYQWYKRERSGRYVMVNVDTDRHANIEVWKVMQGNPLNM